MLTELLVPYKSIGYVNRVTGTLQKYRVNRVTGTLQKYRLLKHVLTELLVPYKSIGY